MGRGMKCVICFLGILAIAHSAPIDITKFPPQQVREFIEQACQGVEADHYDVHTVENATIFANGRNVPVRIYTPHDGENLPIALMMHGGGWAFGSIDTHDNMARFLCQRSGVKIVSVDYALAPEAKFPHGLEECYSILCHLALNHNNISLIGDSAGGNFTAALCLMARDRNGPTVQQQIMINPAPDLRPTVEIEPTPPGDIPPEWYLSLYFSKPEDAHHPYASPMAAEDHTGLPPALVILADQDRLMPSGRAYAEKIKAKVYIQRGIGHLAVNGARATPAALESLEVAAAALKEMTK